MPNRAPTGGVVPPALDIVQVLRLDLDAPPFDEETSALSAVERARASRFVPPDARRRYIAGRTALRRVLGQVLGRSPKDVPLETTETGKPTLSPTLGSDIHFNVSHTGGQGLIALAKGRRVGVDIERLRPLDDAAALVDRFFADAERDHFQALPAGLKNQAFFTLWTRKEAFAKATGRGITDTLHRFAVSVHPAAPPSVVRIDFEGESPEAWSLTDLKVPAGHVGALAVEGSAWQLHDASW